MAIKTSDPDFLIDAVNVSISAYMNANFMELCKDILSTSVNVYVYPESIYSPSSYVRRKNAGGLSDKREYEIEEDPNPWSSVHTISISDNRREANVVNSGSGYTWTRSRIYRMQPFPRPYFAQAEKAISELLDDLMQAVVDGL